MDCHAVAPALARLPRSRPRNAVSKYRAEHYWERPEFLWSSCRGRCAWGTSPQPPGICRLGGEGCPAESSGGARGEDARRAALVGGAHCQSTLRGRRGRADAAFASPRAAASAVPSARSDGRRRLVLGAAAPSPLLDCEGHKLTGREGTSPRRAPGPPRCSGQNQSGTFLGHPSALRIGNLSGVRPIGDAKR